MPAGSTGSLRGMAKDGGEAEVDGLASAEVTAT